MGKTKQQLGITLNPALFFNMYKDYGESQVDYHSSMARLYFDIRMQNNTIQMFHELGNLTGMEHILNAKTSQGASAVELVRNFCLDMFGVHMKFAKYHKRSVECMGDYTLWQLEGINSLLKNGVISFRAKLKQEKIILKTLPTQLRTDDIRKFVIKTDNDFYSDCVRFYNYSSKIIKYIDIIKNKIVDDKVKYTPKIVILGKGIDHISIDDFLSILNLIDIERMKWHQARISGISIIADTPKYAKKKKIVKINKRPDGRGTNFKHLPTAEPNIESYEMTAICEPHSEDVTNCIDAELPLYETDNRSVVTHDTLSIVDELVCEPDAEYTEPEERFIKKHIRGEDLAIKHSTIKKQDSTLGNKQKYILQRIIDGEPLPWRKFEKLILCNKGFGGSICENTGGSSRTILFKHPVTDKYIRFIIHKPHKAGKGNCNLHYDIIKRFKHLLECNDLMFLIH